MITAEINGREHRVDGLVNRGGWFGQTWAVGVGVGYDTLIFVVEADSEQSALDEFADSRFSHLIDITEDEAAEQGEDWTTRAGNDGHPVNLDEMRILERCKVRYFEPAVRMHYNGGTVI